MREVFWQHVLPVGGVALTVAVVTLAVFDVPMHATPNVLGLRVPAAVAPVASSAHARAQVNDTLREVLRTLDDGRKPTPDVPPRARAPQLAASAQPIKGTPAAPGAPGAVPTAAPTADSELLKTATSLGEAVRAIHEARTEEDLVRAEELVRVVRERMEANCATAPGPMCQSAEQIRSLGY